MANETDLDGRMRAVLIQLAMTSNGNTAKMDGNTGGGSVRHYADALLDGWLGPEDAPQLHFFDLYIRETTDEGRLAVVESAEERLDRIRYSRAHAGEEDSESLEDLYDRIVAVGDGWEPNDVANALRITPSLVRRARRERGRDQEKGKPVADGTGLDREERRKRVLHLKQVVGRNDREIARALGIPYSTVRRDLGKKT
jgi:hypothetical protein